MPLNDRQIRNAKPTEAGKKAKLFDGGGLYLEIGASQGAAVATLLEAAAFSDIQIIQDLAGRDRVVKGTFHGRGTSQGNAAPL